MSNWLSRGVDAIIVPGIVPPTRLFFPPTVVPSSLLEVTTKQMVTGIVTTTNGNLEKEDGAERHTIPDGRGVVSKE